MPRSEPIDRFALACDRAGTGPPVVLLHGWPGWRGDYRDVVTRVIAMQAPSAVATLVLSPPLPGIGERILRSEEFWDHWSAPGWQLAPDRLDELVDLYARPGAFTARIAWYRSGSAGVGHFVPLEAPAAVAEATVRALRR